ncbi:MAG: hypothetical protein ACXADO_02985 [Candidatus Thorarchaeota archaeon]|jgi:hypothetical protein
MSGKRGKTLSFKAIKKQQDSLAIDKEKHFLIASSTLPEATMSAALICRSILRSGGLFHMTFLEPVVTIEEVNALRKTHSKSTVILVGIDLVGKKRVKKGIGYPIIIGGNHDSDQTDSLRIGDEHSISGAAYAIAKESLTATSHELQLAAAAALVRNFSWSKGFDVLTQLKGAAKELVSSAQKEKLIEGHRGYRLFGANFFPLNEVLEYSVRPYLQGWSGRREKCEEILDEADVPFPKLRMPISSLTNDEAKRLNGILLSELDSNTTHYILGQDFFLAQERKDSPMRLVSGIRSIAEIALVLQETGTSSAIYMGDRAQQLQSFLNSYRAYSKDLIGAFDRLRVSLEKEEPEIMESLAIIQTREGKRKTLVDIGRITLETGLISADIIMMVAEGEGISLTWKPGGVRLQSLLRSMKKRGIHSTAASTSSIMIENTSEEVRKDIQRTLQKL